MRSLIPITDIANDVCESVGDVQKKHQRSVLRHIARCYQNLYLFLDGTTTVKTEVFPVGNVIELPSDFVYETKVAVKIDDRIVFINKNYDQDSNIEFDANQTQFGMYLADSLNLYDIEVDRSFTPFYNYEGNSVIKAYGSGSYCGGLYNIDQKNGRILLGSNFPQGAEFVLEYKSDGVSNGLDLVPTEMEACLYNYGLWKYYFHRGDPRFRKSEEDYDIARYQLETLYRFKPIRYTSRLYDRYEKGTINDQI